MDKATSLLPNAYLKEIVGSAYSALYRFRHDRAREPERLLISADAHEAITDYLAAQEQKPRYEREVMVVELGPLFLCGIRVDVSDDLTKAEVGAE